MTRLTTAAAWSPRWIADSVHRLLTVVVRRASPERDPPIPPFVGAFVISALTVFARKTR